MVSIPGVRDLVAKPASPPTASNCLFGNTLDVNISFRSKRNSAITLLDILVTLIVLGILLGVLSRQFLIEKRKALRIQCTNNLKQIGNLFNSWTSMNRGRRPMFIDDTNASPMDFDTGANAWRHFRVLSLGLISPKSFFCPAESR